MPTHPQRSRSRARHLTGAITALAAVALAAALTAAPSAGAAPRPGSATRAAERTSVQAAAATTTLPADLSTGMPRTAHNETVGDFMGKGYDQRAVVEAGRLNIYNPPSKGGNRVQSVATDLQGVGPSNSDGRGGHLPVWQGGAMADLADKSQLASVYLAWTPDALYMAGSHNVGVPGAGSDVNLYFADWLYKLPPDGKCASKSCAIAVGKLPALIYSHSVPFIERTEGVTALAVGQVAGKTFVAIGFSDTEAGTMDGALVIDPANLTAADKTAQYPIAIRGGQAYQFEATEPTQTAVTSLAWDPGGSGWLAIGTASPTHTINAIKWRSTSIGNGFVVWSFDPSSYRYWNSNAGDDYAPSALSAAVTDRADGTPVAAFGMSDGTVKLWDPTVTTATLLANAADTGTTDNPNAVDAVSFVDRSDGTGLPDVVAVSNIGNQARVLRYSGATTLAAQAVQPNGVTTTDVGGIRLWYPGYKAGSLQIRNNAPDPVKISFASRPNAAYGCWLGAAFPGREAFPASSITLATKAVSSSYTIGGYTAGIGGGCAASDFTGQWAAYIVIAPLARPANTTTAKLVMSRTGQLSVTAVGGALTLSASQVDKTTFALGGWELGIGGPLPAKAPGATLTATQLDPAGTERPVYRFDLAATEWDLKFSTPPRITAVLPALVAQGSSDNGKTWTDLGRLVPQGQPTRSTEGSVTLAPASFYWQNPSTGAALTTIRVQVGQARSNQIAIGTIAAPAPATHVSQLAVCPASGGSDCSGTAAPFANGLDQAPLRVQVYGDDGQVLPVSDLNYGRIYYRDDNGDLLTGLIPLDGSAYIRVSPYPGEYSNDGSAGSIVRPSPTAPVGGRYAYLSTTSTNAEEITAHVGGSSQTSQLEISARPFTPIVPPGSEAATGFLATGCSDYPGTTYCRLASTTTTNPALFMSKDPDTGAPLIGLMFKTQAQTALASLPLQQLAGQPEHNVAATTLSINNGEVTMDTTSGFQPGDDIDTWLVSHGTSFQARSVKVGGGD